MMMVTQTEKLVKAFRILRELGRQPRMGNGYIKARALGREDKHPSLTVFAGHDGNLIAYDHARGEAMSFAKYVTLYYPEYASEFTAPSREPDWVPRYRRRSVHEKALEDRKKYEGEEVVLPRQEKLEEVKREMSRLQAGLTFAKPEARRYLQSRFPGRTLSELAELGLGLDHRGNIAIPHYVIHEDGTTTLVNIKVRVHPALEDEYGGKYFHPMSGLPKGVYVVGNLESPSRIYVVEGELNAATVYLHAKAVDPNIAVIGLPGASNILHISAAKYLAAKAQEGTPVILKGDNDQPGHALVERLVNQLAIHGAPKDAVFVANFDNLGKDANEWGIILWDFGYRGRVLVEEFLKRVASISKVGTKRKGKGPTAAISTHKYARLEKPSTRQTTIELATLDRKSRVFQRHAPFMGDAGEILESVVAWIIKDTGFAKKPHPNAAVLRTLIYRVVREDDDVKYLLDTYAATVNPGGDRSVYEYGRRRGLLRKYENVVVWRKGRYPQWKVSMGELRKLLYNIIMTKLKELNPRELTPEQLEVYRMVVEIANNGDIPAMPVVTEGKDNPLWQALVRMMRVIVQVIRERINFKRYLEAIKALSRRRSPALAAT